MTEIQKNHSTTTITSNRKKYARKNFVSLMLCVFAFWWRKQSVTSYTWFRRCCFVYTDDYTAYSRSISDSRCDNRSVYPHMKAQVRSTHGDSGRHIRVLCFLSVSEPNRVCILWISCSTKLVLLSTKWKIIREGNRSCCTMVCRNICRKKKKSKPGEERIRSPEFYFGCNFCFVFLCSAIEIFNFI